MITVIIIFFLILITTINFP